MELQSTTVSHSQLLWSALSTLISLKGDNFSQGEIEARICCEEGCVIEAQILLDDGFNPPVFHAPTLLNITIKDGAVETISENGQEMFIEILEDVPAFTQAVAIVVAAAIEALSENLDYLLSQSTGAGWVDPDSSSEVVLEALDEISGTINTNLENLNRSVSRRGAVKHFSRLALKASSLGRV